MYNPRAHTGIIYINHHARIQNLFPNSDGFFVEGKDYPNSTESGPLLARQQNAIQMAFRWLEQANDGPTLNAGLVAFWFSADPDQFC